MKKKTLSSIALVPAFVAVLAICGCTDTVQEISGLRGYVPKDCTGDACATAPAPAPAPQPAAAPAPVILKQTVDPDVMPPPAEEMPVPAKKHHADPLDAS